MGSRMTIYSVALIKESSKIYDVNRAITSPDIAYEVIEKVLHLTEKTKEHFCMLSLNAKKQVIGVHTIHIGSVSVSIVHPRDVLQPAILNNASCFMVFHNHPSGNPEPSPEDIDITKRLQQAGTIMGIELVDHLIVGDGCYTSLKGEGYME